MKSSATLPPATVSRTGKSPVGSWKNISRTIKSNEVLDLIRFVSNKATTVKGDANFAVVTSNYFVNG